MKELTYGMVSLVCFTQNWGKRGVKAAASRERDENVEYSLLTDIHSVYICFLCKSVDIVWIYFTYLILKLAFIYE